MGDAPRPDPVVSDETGRRTIDRMTELLTGAQRARGEIPSAAEAEAYVRPVVERQVRVHEERCANGVPERAPRGDKLQADPDSPARITRGEVGEDAAPIMRPLDSMEWQRDRTAPAGRRHVNGRDSRPLELRLLEARARLLMGLPEWERRLLNAADDAVAIANRNGFGADIQQTQDLQAEMMLKVIDDSSRIFGDWRTPRATGPTRQYYLTPAGLVPVAVPGGGGDDV